MVIIRQATSAEADWLQTSFGTYVGWKKPEGYFAEVCRLQDDGAVVLLIAIQDDQYLAHCKIVWSPEYPHFRDHHIPEIQDLNVRSDFHRRGIATQLMDECERRIKERSDVAGIGFGLHFHYGVAQQMYTKRGYVPDGHGVYYNHAQVTPNKAYPVDDDLVLYLTKKL